MLLDQYFDALFNCVSARACACAYIVGMEVSTAERGRGAGWRLSDMSNFNKCVVP